MHFRTQIPVLKGKNPIDFPSKMVSLGSCFAVNMAEKLTYFKFQNAVNPFGILFHPIAIEKLIGFAVSDKTFDESDIFFHNERWHCFDAHSDLSSVDKTTLISNLNLATKSLKNQISEATHIIITYGTSWVYREKTSNTIVANCHKLPQQHFEKEILSVEVISNAIQKTIASIASINSNVEIIFTVSPVRHTKDGFVENQWSKANLISALHAQICTLKWAHYFPSYEIMMDELRDYRFYAEDMIHPSPLAIDYIWERFSAAWLSENAFPIMEKVGAIQKGLAHRPFNADSELHKKFLSELRLSIEDLQQQFPHMIF